jgi:hypothetical protein
MKKKLLSLTLLTGMSLATQAADYQYLVFTMSDGTTKSITATGLTMHYSNGTLTVSNGSTTLSLSTDQLKKMEFSDTQTAGIEKLTIDEMNNSDAQITDLSGRRMTLPYNQLPKGVYIITSNGKTTKIQVR